ncbi:MAG: urea ABC transporter permease subunit UrtB [Gemmataceae bacterium]|nr:urea ABC transporter permease subunit UrtB [Gemmataceae bacterium]
MHQQPSGLAGVFAAAWPRKGQILLACAGCWLLYSIVVRVKDMSVENLGGMFSNSISLSSILILTALGLAITFGVMRVINMAHGDLMMLGAYTAFFFTNKRALPIVVRNVGNWFGERWEFELAGSPIDYICISIQSATGTLWHVDLNLYLAIPLSFLVVAAVGYLMEVLLIRHLYSRPLDTLLATWGVGMIMQQSVYHLFGPNLQPMHMPEGLQGGPTIGELTIPTFRFFIVGVTLVCLLLVYLWFYRTTFGLKVRAVVQNRAMASALGISTRRVDAVSFAFASGLAGVAGCIFAHLYNVNYAMGSEYVVDAFMVVILGGLGQIPGAIAGGLLIGTSNNVITRVFGIDEVIAKVLVLLMIVAFIMVRPSGLVKTSERTYD